MSDNSKEIEVTTEPITIRGDQVRCPRCGSTQISAQKEGFNANKGCCGAILLGPLGLLCGTFGANKMNIHCLSCGYKWAPDTKK